jgi:hypothetical protein
MNDRYLREADGWNRGGHNKREGIRGIPAVAGRPHPQVFLHSGRRFGLSNFLSSSSVAQMRNPSLRNPSRSRSCSVVPVVLRQLMKVERIFEHRPGVHSRLDHVVQADEPHDGARA